MITIHHPMNIFLEINFKSNPIRVIKNNEVKILNRMKSTILICGIVFLLLTTTIFASINGVGIDTSSNSNAVPMSSDIGDWDVIAEDITVEWDDTNVADNLRESIYSLVVGDWVWTNPITIEDVLFDEIELRRLVRDDINEYHDAILILPMMFAEANAMFHWKDYFTGEQLNNPEDMFIYPYVEAGFDVYCLSTRDHNVPIEFQHDPASWTEMMRWGVREYLDDIHEAVELIKIVSGFERIYLNTQEIGTALGMMYAVEHEENLKGIVAISGGTGGMLDKPPLLPEPFWGVDLSIPPYNDLTWWYDLIEEDPTIGSSIILQFINNYYKQAFYNPDSPDIIEPFGVPLSYLWGIPLAFDSKIEALRFLMKDILGISVLDPYISMDVHDWLGMVLSLHAWYPYRVLVDIQHMNAVADSPYLEIDWDEHFDEVDIPILTFVDTLAINWWDQADYSDDTRNPDNTVYIMENQGVPDLLLGAHYRELIIYPSIEWMLERHINDVTKPVIIIISPSEGVITNQDVVLTYTVSDDVSAPENIVITGSASGTTYTSEGCYHEVITATDEAGNIATASVSFIIDKTAPEITIDGPPEGCYNTDQIVTWSVSDTNLDINSIDANYPELWTFDTEGTYQVEVSAFDFAGNFASASSAQFVIDKTKPITSIEFDPPYFEINDIIHLTSTTPIELKPKEIQGGSSIDETYYRISNSTYDSGEILYTGIFTLNQEDLPGLYDGSYDIEYYSTDNAGNIEDPPKSKRIVLDNTPPELSWEFEGYALQDGFVFDIEALDATEVTGVTVSIRELNGPVVAGIPVEYVGGNHWRAVDDLKFDTTILPDGYYELVVEASDKFDFATTEVFSFSIRNWAVLDLLPSTESNKAGRTMPVKFALRVIYAVDPSMPFVVNQELDIFISDTSSGDIMQHSTYGDTSRDYRINEITELYITNFKTQKTPTTYFVSIYRGDFFIDKFSFDTKQ